MEKGFLKKTYLCLDKVKFFGLRKLYYLGKDLLYKVYLRTLFLNDIFSPTLNSRFLSKKIIDYFNGDSGHNLDPKKPFLGFGLIHYSFVRNIKPKRILCIGSRKGYIPAILALACKDNKIGSVDFVDASFDENHPQSWTGVGFWKKVNPAKHFSFLGLNSWIKTYIMLSADFAAKYPKRRYSYIYIDGDHSYQGVKTDHYLFWPKLEKGGFMVFHDVIMKGSDSVTNQSYGVWRFWQELKGNKIIFPFPLESGLGVMQKY